jgi:hypothetical protein
MKIESRDRNMVFTGRKFFKSVVLGRVMRILIPLNKLYITFIFFLVDYYIHILELSVKQLVFSIYIFCVNIIEKSFLLLTLF